MNMTPRTLQAATVVLALLASSLNAEEIDVFFYSGQSNASGRISTGYTPDARDGQVMYYYRTDGPSTQDVTSLGTFTTLAPLQTGYYGAEISMGRGMVDSGYNPAIIKISDGGTSLAGGWTSRRNGVWWNHWKNDGADALADLEAQGHTVNVRAFFWMQGESDAHETKTSNFRYEDDLTFFVQDTRDYLGTLGYETANVAFITALIQDFNPPHSNIVRNAQINVMDTVENGGWFDTADLDLMDDIHFDANAVEILGDRFVNEFQSLTHTPEPSTFGLFLILAPAFKRNR